MGRLSEGFVWARGDRPLRPVGYTGDEVAAARQIVRRGAVASDARQAPVVLLLAARSDGGPLDRTLGALLPFVMLGIAAEAFSDDVPVVGVLALLLAVWLAVRFTTDELSRPRAADSARLTREHYDDLDPIDLREVEASPSAKALGIFASVAFYAVGFGILGEILFEDDPFDVGEAAVRGAVFGVAVTAANVLIVRRGADRTAEA